MLIIIHKFCLLNRVRINDQRAFAFSFNKKDKVCLSRKERELYKKVAVSASLHSNSNLSTFIFLSFSNLDTKTQTEILKTPSSHALKSSTGMMMMTSQTPLAGDKQLQPKSGRTPLQPKNPPADPRNSNTQEEQISKPKQGWIEMSLDDGGGDSNKENQLHPVSTYATPVKKLAVMDQPLDCSLAEELTAIRKKMERLRAEKERTEKTLRERVSVLDLQMKELEQRGEAQKKLENEVDRLFRLKELQSYCTRISPIRSLREKMQEKGITQVHFLEMEGETVEEGSVDGSAIQSPSSSCCSTSNPISESKLVAVK